MTFQYFFIAHFLSFSFLNLVKNSSITSSVMSVFFSFCLILNNCVCVLYRPCSNPNVHCLHHWLFCVQNSTELDDLCTANQSCHKGYDIFIHIIFINDIALFFSSKLSLLLPLTLLWLLEFVYLDSLNNFDSSSQCN